MKRTTATEKCAGVRQEEVGHRRRPHEHAREVAVGARMSNASSREALGGGGRRRRRPREHAPAQEAAGAAPPEHAREVAARTCPGGARGGGRHRRRASNAPARGGARDHALAREVAAAAVRASTSTHLRGMSAAAPRSALERWPPPPREQAVLSSGGGRRRRRTSTHCSGGGRRRRAREHATAREGVDTAARACTSLGGRAPPPCEHTSGGCHRRGAPPPGWLPPSTPQLRRLSMCEQWRNGPEPVRNFWPFAS
jgi:hypothetical protein